MVNIPHCRRQVVHEIDTVPLVLVKYAVVILILTLHEIVRCSDQIKTNSSWNPLRGAGLRCFLPLISQIVDPKGILVDHIPLTDNTGHAIGG